MPFTIHQADVDDTPAIAAILAEEPSPFLRLLLGTVDPETLNQNLAQRIAEQLANPKHTWMVARDSDSGAVASYAQWQIPASAEAEAEVEKSEAEQEAETEAYKAKLAPGMNVSLNVDFRAHIHKLRKEALQGRRHYLLANLGTAVAFRSKGAASQLVRWVFEPADHEDVVVYLDTATDGPGRPLYTKLGFQQVGESTIDLSQHGSEGTHEYIGMIRNPVPCERPTHTGS